MFSNRLFISGIDLFLKETSFVIPSSDKTVVVQEGEGIPLDGQPFFLTINAFEWAYSVETHPHLGLRDPLKNAGSAPERTALGDLLFNF